MSNEELNGLFSTAWPEHKSSDFGPVLAHSLLYVSAYRSERLIGFVNVAWDGGFHAFILDTTVHPDERRKGIGRELVRRAADAARDRNVEWLHVDFEPDPEPFHRSAGFRHTEAGLIHFLL